MTTKLFWQDSYLTSCKAIVTSIDGKKVKLDQTVFYAFSGGQESDTGTIGGITVLNAIKQGEKENIIDIEYELEEEPSFKVGDTVDVAIDGTRREKLRKLHSAIHIAYYFLIEKLGQRKIIGSHVAAEKARIDFECDTPLTSVLSEIENKMNTFLLEDHAIVREIDAAKSDLRWWVCEEWRMPCGGTHVLSTKEIGRVLLKRKNIGNGKERMEIYLI